MGSLRRRTRWRRHWPLPTALVAVSALLITVVGTWMVMPYVGAGGSSGAERLTGRNIENADGIDPLDDRLVHTIEVEIDQHDYETMITDHRLEGLKEFVPVNVTIDGTRLKRVGLRLKGNSTLFNLFIGVDLREMAKQGGGFGGGARMGRPLPGVPDPPPTTTTVTSAGAGPGAGAGETTEFTLPEFPEPVGFPDPTTLPYLFQFDEYVPGQTYQGRRQLALRGDAPLADTSLHPEAIVNRVLLDLGEPTTVQSYTGVSFNGGPERLLLLSEVPDDEMAERSFPGRRGILYKTQTGAPFRYLGPHPTDYIKWFEVDAGIRQYDLQPLIAFLRFLSESDDATFAAELPQHMDVAQLARYLAVHNLLVNADSLAGIGNNFYLWYDLDSRRFQVVSWDVNGGLGRITIGADAVTYSPYYDDPVSFGGRDQAKGGEKRPQIRGSMLPGPKNGATGMIPSGVSLEENLLKIRFFKTPTFKALYEQTYRDLYRQVLADGLAYDRLTQYDRMLTEALATRPSLVDAQEYRALADSNLAFLTQRRDALRDRAPIR